MSETHSFDYLVSGNEQSPRDYISADDAMGGTVNHESASGYDYVPNDEREIIFDEEEEQR